MTLAGWRRVIGTVAFAGLGGLTLVVGALVVRGADAQTRALSHDVAVARGWIHALPSLKSALQRWDSHRRPDEPTAPSTWVTDRLQQALTQSGVQVLSVEPEPAVHSEPSSGVTALAVSVSGTAPQLAELLQTLPQWLPGVVLDRVELGPREHGVEGRLRVTVPHPVDI